MDENSLLSKQLKQTITRKASAKVVNAKKQQDTSPQATVEAGCRLKLALVNNQPLIAPEEITMRSNLIQSVYSQVAESKTSNDATSPLPDWNVFHDKSSAPPKIAPDSKFDQHMSFKQSEYANDHDKSQISTFNKSHSMMSGDLKEAFTFLDAPATMSKRNLHNMGGEAKSNASSFQSRIMSSGFLKDKHSSMNSEDKRMLPLIKRRMTVFGTSSSAEYHRDIRLETDRLTMSDIEDFAYQIAPLQKMDKESKEEMKRQLMDAQP